MKLFATGKKKQIEELQARLASEEQIDWTIGQAEEASNFRGDLIIDLNFDDHPENIQFYHQFDTGILILSSVKCQLRKVLADAEKKLQVPVAGLNALPTFINRPFWEMSFVFKGDATKILEKLDTINIKSKKVEDRVGMITPRVIFTIINEAFYTVQEGTAKRTDIDRAMKLGTNYPQGPFEWTDKIGIENVYNTLNALYLDTKEDRYKPCPLLKSSYYESLILEKQS